MRTLLQTWTEPQEWTRLTLRPALLNLLPTEHSSTLLSINLLLSATCLSGGVGGGQGNHLHCPPTHIHLHPSSHKVESSEDPSLADPSALKPAKARVSSCQSKTFQLPCLLICLPSPTHVHRHTPVILQLQEHKGLPPAYLDTEVPFNNNRAPSSVGEGGAQFTVHRCSHSSHHA